MVDVEVEVVLPLGPPQDGELSEQVNAKDIAGSARKLHKTAMIARNLFMPLINFFMLFMFLDS